ncbi:hypothetical protein [Polaribacter tangerinus]|uniref:hypothetical protein n=1 Tax=Polaribacter tangerinus TaxID=1920034 RepID=UPI000B4B4867|nr:hypothetical protein [Polaribacter tangerinus]
MKTVKSKTIIKIGILELLTVLTMIFIAGIIISSTISLRFVIAGLLIFGAGNILLRKRVKVIGK